MRIEFPNVAREDFHWTQAQLTIGSAPDNDLVLAASQASAKHLRIQQDRRGLVLQVLPSAGRIHVNARPVREKALLRAGDVISLGDCRMLLRSDQDPALRSSPAMSAQVQCTVALRAVSGPLSGRVLPLEASLELGAQGRYPLELPQGENASLRIHWQHGQLVLESTQTSERFPLRVNGVIANNVALQPGDQVGVGIHRFLLDAPGMEAEPEVVRREPPPVRLPEATAGPSGEVWWLIATAALIAVGISLVLLLHL